MNFSYLIPVTRAAETIHANGDDVSHSEMTSTPGEGTNHQTASGNETHTETGTTTHQESTHAEGLTLQPSTIGFQALNFVVLLVILNLILYKPLTKLLKEREQKIREGVENAEKAEATLQEAGALRQDMMKKAHAESQQMLEKARKSGEELKASIVQDAHTEAGNIIKSGHELVEMEKAKTLQEMKINAVKVIVKATERILKEKIDPTKDARLIEDSLQSYS